VLRLFYLSLFSSSGLAIVRSPEIYLAAGAFPSGEIVTKVVSVIGWTTVVKVPSALTLKMALGQATYGVAE